MQSTSVISLQGARNEGIDVIEDVRGEAEATPRPRHAFGEQREESLEETRYGDKDGDGDSGVEAHVGVSIGLCG